MYLPTRLPTYGKGRHRKVVTSSSSSSSLVVVTRARALSSGGFFFRVVIRRLLLAARFSGVRPDDQIQRCDTARRKWKYSRWRFIVPRNNLPPSWRCLTDIFLPYIVEMKVTFSHNDYIDDNPIRGVLRASESENLLITILLLITINYYWWYIFETCSQTVWFFIYSLVFVVKKVYISYIWYKVNYIKIDKLNM